MFFTPWATILTDFSGTGFCSHCQDFEDVTIVVLSIVSVRPEKGFCHNDKLESIPKFNGIIRNMHLKFQSNFIPGS
jgi:hypothetical protein